MVDPTSDAPRSSGLPIFAAPTMLPSTPEFGSFMLSKLLLHLGLIAPPSFDTVEEMQPGPCFVRGHLHSTSTLESPIARQPCVAFWYQAWFTGIRGAGGSVKRLRSVVAYAPELAVVVPDGMIALGSERASSEPPEMTPGQHRRLDSSDIPGFKARERLILDGDPIRARGSARWSDSECLWRLDPFDLLLQDLDPETRPRKK